MQQTQKQQNNQKIDFDIIVVGGGHAGLEAAHIAAKMGAKVHLLTILVENIALASCNPAIGGLGKGHLVKEIDALGGVMGQITDKCGIQYRTLNASKGPAVRGTRAQIDMDAYRIYARNLALNTPNLTISQEMACEILLDSSTNTKNNDFSQQYTRTKKAIGIRTNIGKTYYAHKIIITTGTFLRGLVHIGETQIVNGRFGESASNELSESLKNIGLKLGRLKTGTCPRIDGRSIDFSSLEKHLGDSNPPHFSYHTSNGLAQSKTDFKPLDLPCFVTYTNEKTHNIIRKNFHRAPLFTGQIEGVGPRYCPSIEDKINRFANKERHQLFLEPQTKDCVEYYINGLTTSLPVDVQEQVIHSIKGLENARITRYGYAIEYDYVEPTQLKHTLECKEVDSLYLAGQINGTTGYEEAGALGLMAGINATLSLKASNSPLGMQCGKILDFSECTDTKSANIPKNPKNLHSHTAPNGLRAERSKNARIVDSSIAKSSLRDLPKASRGNPLALLETQNTHAEKERDCHADFQYAHNDNSICCPKALAKVSQKPKIRDISGLSPQYDKNVKNIAISIIKQFTATLKILIFLTGAITMTTYANQTTHTKQDTKSAQIAKNNAKSATLTHTQIKGIKIPVIYEYSALIPAGNIQLVFQGGGSINTDKIALSALKDEILSRGTSKSGNLGFANKLEKKAISLSASSGNQTLNFYLSFLKEYQKDAIDLLGELLHYPNLKEINKAKTALQARILNNKSDFDFLASELLNKQLFAGTPLANPSLGTQKDVKAISTKDIKASLDSTLNLSNVIIIIGGDVELESSLKMLDSILKDLKKGEPYTKKHFEINTKPSFVSENAPTQQAYIYFGSPLKMQNLKEERYLARVAGFILGASGFGSRLMEEVRVKRGLAYGAYFRYVASPLISYGIGQLQTKLESQDEAIKVVREIISDFVKNGATQKELDSAKQFLLGSEPLGNETLSQRLGRSFNEYFLGLGIGFYKLELEKIKNLELKTLNNYIKSHPEIAELTFGVITQESNKNLTDIPNQNLK